MYINFCQKTPALSKHFFFVASDGTYCKLTGNTQMCMASYKYNLNILKKQTEAKKF